MADDIRIKDLQSTASYMESDDYLPIDGLALGNRKIPFTGLMDSEDDRLPTTDKTPRGAITEHEGDISEIKQSLSVLNDEITLSNNQKAYVTKYGRICQLTYSNNQSASVSSITGQLPNDYIAGHVIGVKYVNCDIYVNAAGAFEISANGWANLIITYIV